MAKQYYIDDFITICYPFETARTIQEYGVLKDVVGKRMSRNEIDKVICEMVIRHPYVSGSMTLNISAVWEDGNMSGYYHIFNFPNDRCDEQDKEPCPIIRYEQ